MGKFRLVLFHDEKRAFQGFHALEDLRDTGSISVLGAALVERDGDGLLSLRKATAPMGLGAGFGVVARAPNDLLQFLARDLAPGTFALVAELPGERLSSIDARMEPLGGTLMIEWRTGDGPHETEPARSSDSARALGDGQKCAIYGYVNQDAPDVMRKTSTADCIVADDVSTRGGDRR